MSNARGSAVVFVLILLIAVALAVGNVFVLSHAMQPAPTDQSLALSLEAVRAAFERAPLQMIHMALSPLLAAVVIIALVATRRESPVAAPAPADAELVPPGPPPAPPFTSALRLLALLQQEGRFIDFLEENIDPYSDAQVGAAVRSIHSGCRQALHERMQIERVYTQDDGAEVEVASGFDAASVRLTGNVHGQPPFRGTLQHGGWRATNIKLPETPPGFDASVLAPAEVEIP